MRLSPPLDFWPWHFIVFGYGTYCTCKMAKSQSLKSQVELLKRQCALIWSTGSQEKNGSFVQNLKKKETINSICSLTSTRYVNNYSSIYLLQLPCGTF